MTGHRPDEFYADSKLMLRLVHPGDLAVYMDSVNNPLKYAFSPFSLRLVHKDNKTIWVEGKCIPNYDEKNKILFLEGILRDVTTRKELEEMTIRADRLNMVGEMAASVAHVIRNPLTTVHGYLQMMRQKDEFSKYNNRINMMLEELTKINVIISEYLTLTQNKRIELNSCNLNSIIERAFPLIQTSATASNVEVHLNLKDIPPLYLDENEIRQLLLNLTQNSIEAMPSGGNIIISTKLEENKAVLSVIDQGIGIPDHIIKDLGTPFLTSKTQGIGLGLPMCQRIANRHNALLEVKTGDKGTKVLISFDPNLMT
jgi:signal transduction histidine kinase